MRESRPAGLLQTGLLSEGQNGEWDRFVLGHPRGGPFHLIAWKKSIEETFGYRPLYVMAAEGARIRAVLPLFLVRNPLIGKALISSPFAVYGGLLCDSEESRAAVRGYVEELSRYLAVDYVELRNAHEEQCLGFERVSRYVTFEQQVGPDEQVILQSIPRKTRRMVRIALEKSFEMRATTDSAIFEDLYSKNLRRLGTPCFPRRHFARLRANYAGMLDFREVWLEGKAVAAVMSLYYMDRVLPYYGASDPEVNYAAPNNFMYFDLMRQAGENGYRRFDFGRSKKGSGSYDFKSHWGMVERELPYEILPVRRKSIPNFSPANAAFRLPIEIWRRLPLWLTRMLGPFLIRLTP